MIRSTLHACLLQRFLFPVELRLTIANYIARKLTNPKIHEAVEFPDLLSNDFSLWPDRMVGYFRSYQLLSAIVSQCQLSWIQVRHLEISFHLHDCCWIGRLCRYYLQINI